MSFIKVKRDTSRTTNQNHFEVLNYDEIKRVAYVVDIPESNGPTGRIRHTDKARNICTVYLKDGTIFDLDATDKDFDQIVSELQGIK